MQKFCCQFLAVAVQLLYTRPLATYFASHLCVDGNWVFTQLALFVKVRWEKLKFVNVPEQQIIDIQLMITRWWQWWWWRSWWRWWWRHAGARSRPAPDSRRRKPRINVNWQLERRREWEPVKTGKRHFSDRLTLYQICTARQLMFYDLKNGWRGVNAVR